MFVGHEHARTENVPFSFVPQKVTYVLEYPLVKSDLESFTCSKLGTLFFSKAFLRVHKINQKGEELSTFEAERRKKEVGTAPYGTVEYWRNAAYILGAYAES